MENKKIIMSILCTIPNIEDITIFLKKYLKDDSFHYQVEDEVHSYTLKDYTRLNVRKSPLADTEEKFNKQIRGIFNYYASVKAKNKNVQLGLLQQLQIVNNIITYEFEITEDDNRNKFLFNSCFVVAKEIKGCVLMNNLDILNYDSKLILNKEGDSLLETFTPTALSKNLFYRDTEETQEDILLYTDSINEVRSKNIKCLDKMELALRASDIKVKTVNEICERLIALFTLALYSEAVLKKVDPQIILTNIEKQYDYKNYLSQNENLYINAKNISEMVTKQFVWRYEACSVLLYVLGLIEINDINKPADVSNIVQIMKKFKNKEELIAASSLIDTNKIHRLQDVTMRYHWACINAHQNNEKLENVINGIIIERHLILNWLLTDFYGNSWDNIKTPA